MDCLGLSKQKFHIHNKDSTSDSIVVFLRTLKTTQDAVLKISTASTKYDNSLEVEREVYNLVKTKLSKWSPHFLIPLHSGHCSDDEVVAMRNSKKKWEREMYEQWIMLRNTAIEKELKDKGTSWGELLSGLPSNVNKKSEMDVGKYLLQKHTVWKNKFRQMWFVLTPHLKDEPLNVFFSKLKRKLPTSSVRAIAIQLAQALSVFALHHVMSNDLHFGNVFIQTLNKPQTIEYTFPRKCTIKSKYFLTIYDFDRSYVEGGTKNTSLEPNPYFESLCKQYGECNKYFPKTDWYSVLTSLVYFTQNEDIEDVLKNMYQEVEHLSIGKDAAFSRACTCQKLDPKKRVCLKCKPKSLSRLITPRTYFLRNTDC